MSAKQRRPSVLINQIVRHFSHLFQVKSIEGVLPKMNVRFQPKRLRGLLPNAAALL